MVNLKLKAKLALASFVLIALISQLTLTASPVYAQIETYKFDQTATLSAKELDNRAIILRDYLSLRNSPMTDNAQDFIEAADTYGVDWKLVPAIAGVESTFGQATPGGYLYPSYNAWGWGVYGTQAIYFKSWKDGIYTLNQGLKEKYIRKGLTDPYSMNTVYAASPAWGSHVSYFLTDIDQFAKKHELQTKNTRLDNLLSFTKVQPKPAPVPSALAFK